MCWGVRYSQRWRETGEEQRELERLNFDVINEVRQAAEVHRQVLPGAFGHRHLSRGHFCCKCSEAVQAPVLPCATASKLVACHTFRPPLL